MKLPKIDVITHMITVPSTKEEISIRPFLVKEQKILLTAATGGDIIEEANAVKQVVNNCIVTPEFKVDKLEVFDLEYIMLQLRIISVGETTKLIYAGGASSDCAECRKEKEIELNLKEVAVNFDNVKDNKIQLTESVGVLMKYPSHKNTALYAKNINDDSANLKFIWSCVESVYDKNSVISNKDVSESEGIEFLESLETKQFNLIEEFLDNMPKLSHTVKLTCSTCGKITYSNIKGLDNFLG
jgi:hypothetical protein